ncbi:aldehyde dehydrogenase family protein [Streptomyces sp. ML-6]|uniref:aldehyde dehydrogenase family protein n=1 Tax=Streptomyces sp. ML-6 TaxID=2982693 RepID=UPI0024BFA1BB|nr:aldehyde dehydrogenase family protein [Streptomyces sp. ML-6]MDK0524277.1 aldehyde dehydrogenase family protein [Streptomyces sp. ML-6]
MTFLDITDPRTGEVYDNVPNASAEEVDHAVRTADSAFGAWRSLTPGERHDALLALADAIVAQSEQLAAVECRNTGKDAAEVLTEEIPAAVDEIRFMAGAARAGQGPMAGEYVKGHTSMVVREPVGVCALIAPWNHPLGSAVDKLAPALAAGNTVVLKPAETTPMSALLLGEICDKVLPRGVVNVVCGDRDTGRALAVHPLVSLVSLTGSTRAGAEVTAAAGLAGIKRLHLELGGDAPAIVLADADQGRAADGIVEAAFYNAGQDCTAACRVLVAAEAYDGFVALLAERAARAEVGPLNNRAHLSRVNSYLTELPGHATVVTGGAPAAGPGFHFQPTVVTGVRQHDLIVQHEVFGPVITVQPFADEDEAVRMANDVPLGLAASVWTGDPAAGNRLAHRIDAGTVWLNTHNVYATEMPHGGFKQSGYGKDLSTYALDAYTRTKHIMSRTSP